MTGRELIMYILENHLEDEPVFQNGTFVGYMSDKKFAEMCGFGTATIHAWIAMGYIVDTVTIGDQLYIPVASKLNNLGSDKKCETN